jgi:hypothetical protein
MEEQEITTIDKLMVIRYWCIYGLRAPGCVINKEVLDDKELGKYVVYLDSDYDEDEDAPGIIVKLNSKGVELTDPEWALLLIGTDNILDESEMEGEKYKVLAPYMEYMMHTWGT